MTSAILAGTHSARRTLALVSLVLGLYFVSRWWMEQVALGSAQAVVAALIPVPALLYVYCSWILRALRGDELERRIALEGLSIGFGVTFAFVVLLSQLERAVPPGALWADFGDVALAAAAATFFGVAMSRRRYG